MTYGKLGILKGNRGEVIVAFGSVRPDFGGGKTMIIVVWDEVEDDEWDLVC